MSQLEKQLAKPRFIQGLSQAIGDYVAQYLEEPKQQIGELTTRVGSLEKRMENVAITRSQSRKIQKTVAEKAHQMAKDSGDTPAKHFAAIYSGLKDLFNVPSYLDIPREKYFEAMSAIAKYDGSSKDWWRD